MRTGKSKAHAAAPTYCIWFAARGFVANSAWTSRIQRAGTYEWIPSEYYYDIHTNDRKNSDKSTVQA